MTDREKLALLEDMLELDEGDLTLDKALDDIDEYDSIKRCIDWDRGEPYTFTVSDYDMLMNSGCFFARKFSSQVDKNIIDKIYNKLR